MSATFDDVNLILKLYEMGSEPNASYRMVTSYWEMVASFITDGVLNAELFYKSGRELLFVYARLRHVLPAIREKYENPGELKNLELAALTFVEWWNGQHPGAFEAFCGRIGA